MYSEERLKEVMGAILGIPPDSIGRATSTDTIDGWDSLKHMRLIIALEEAFDVTIPDDEVVTMTSYEIVKLVVAEQAGTR